MLGQRKSQKTETKTCNEKRERLLDDRRVKLSQFQDPSDMFEKLRESILKTIESW